MPSIYHKTRVSGTDISKSANYGEEHEVEGGAIGTTEIADGAVTAAKLAANARFYRYVKSGTSPITFAHNIGQAPTGVIGSIRALQPYPAPTFNWDATNIYVYHGVTAGTTVSIIAWVEP